MGDYQLRQVAEVVGDEIKKIPDVAQVNVVGGQSREVKVMLDKDKMAQSKLDFGAITQALQANNSQMQSGNIITGDMVYSVQTGSFFADVEEVRNLIVGTNDNQPVYLYQIAEIEDGPEVPKQYGFVRLWRRIER